MNAQFFTAWVEETARTITADRDRLTALDAAIGDADHGTNLDRGFTAVREALSASSPAGPGAVLILTGTTLIRKVGGASGPLYGTAYRHMGTTLTARAAQAVAGRAGTGLDSTSGAVPGTGIEAPGPGTAGFTGTAGARDEAGPGGAPGDGDHMVMVTLADLAAAFEAGLAAVCELGGAAEGDKTMVDALAPATRALAEAARAGLKPEDAFDAALAAARAGARATIPLQARKGRASYLGERSAGHEDPGAASTVLLFTALRTVAGG
ncbi:dihydroxyacetone kinase subunit L [Sphaerisporangium melleum]|uniref:Dihydroxyacetone kinase subunit L n=1 Tax=Sphaerisporangium melleum TaxID=321316 RepID=A0A917R9I2_9ACTN|nr:DAK2 domain-containing protein [Sphaerisporangium melleum]GGK95729.1 dihydroxyacetone kinase subunit L [Sphaerisporangium melleum]GII70638.1 dihydroxyacetone kinase subunit L [Sphaerisporangium melleum]